MRNWLKRLLHALAAIFILFNVIACTDPYLDDTERFIKAESTVQRKVGKVKSLSRSNTIIVRAGDQTKPYREYQFIVRGAEGKALVSVQIFNIEDPSKRSYLIKSIDEL